MNLEFRLRFHQERVRTRWDGGGRGGGGGGGLGGA